MNRQEQMKQMIREEIQSISSLDERIILKDLMEGVFLSLYETNERMYKQLEDRVMNDLSYDINQYLIKTGLVERKLLDPTHHFMTVMQEQDWKQKELSVKEVRQTIAETGRCFLGSIFLKCDYLDIRNMLRSQFKLSGTIQVDHSYKVTLALEQNTRYLEKVEQLYHLFIKNGIPWKTVNCPYLFKLVDVYAKAMPDACEDKEIIQSFQVDLGGYTSSVCYDMVPIWNVWHLKIDSIGFPVACKDHENYEHEISLAEYDNAYVYLVDSSTNIHSIRRNEEKIILTSQEQMPQEWNIYSIRNANEGRVSSYTYPVMENLRHDGFAERYQRKAGIIVKTKMELERFIRGFGLDEYLEYRDCKIVENPETSPETYPMNFFLKDEIRDSKKQKRLVLIFRPNNVNPMLWLLRDLLSFVVSEVQEMYPEYECGGELE